MFSEPANLQNQKRQPEVAVEDLESGYAIIWVVRWVQKRRRKLRLRRCVEVKAKNTWHVQRTRLKTFTAVCHVNTPTQSITANASRGTIATKAYRSLPAAFRCTRARARARNRATESDADTRWTSRRLDVEGELLKDFIERLKKRRDKNVDKNRIKMRDWAKARDQDKWQGALVVAFVLRNAS